MFKFLCKLLMFLLIPLVVAEVFSRVAFRSDWYEGRWYNAKASEVKNAPDAVILVGSSRTASMDNERLQEELQKESGKPVKVFNMGMGYSTMVEHYLGLRKLAQERGNLNGVRVVLESSNGFPSEQRWHDDWVQPESPQMICALMKNSDLGKFWSESSCDVPTKLFITLGKELHCVRHFARMRAFVLSAPDKVLAKVFKSSGPETATLDNAGGTRSDRGTVTLLRAKMEQTAEKTRTGSEKAIFGSDTVFTDVVKLCRENGAKVYEYAPPHSSVDVDYLKWERSPEAVAAYDAFLKQNQVPILFLGMSVSDDDFPDLLHIGKPRRAEFATKLAGALR